MKINKLTISAFGPYSKKTEIDFSKFNKTGIYLITGDTGAGKTTIFDAISFALYGASSGGLREAKMLRSEYADKNIATFVDLEFEYKNRTYRVWRNPSYERPKKRGEGTTRQDASAVLYLDDGSKITSMSEVDSYIVNLLGLVESQFKQIAMIAQGDFLKLLHATNDEKRELFRKIFSTEKYSLLERCIKDDRASLSSKVEDEKKTIHKLVEDLELGPVDLDRVVYDGLEEGHIDMKDYMNNFTKGPTSDFRKDLASLSLIDPEGFSKEIKKIVGADEKLLQEILGQVSFIGKLMDREKIKISQAEEYRRLEEELESKRIDFEGGKKSLILLEEEKNINKDIDKEIEALSSRLSVEENDLARYEYIDKVCEEIGQIERDKKGLELWGKKLAKNLEDSKTQKKEKENFIEKNSQASLERLKVENEIKEVTDKSFKLEEIQKLFEEIAGYRSSLAQKKIKLEESMDKIKIISSKRDKMEDIYYRSQAGLLASSLEEGVPCPVCGSLSHPDPASLSDDFIDKKTLDKTNKDLVGLKEKREKESIDLARIRASLDEKTASLNKNMKDLDLDKENFRDQDNVIQLLSKTKEDLNDKKKRVEKLKDLEEKLLGFKDDLKAIKEVIEGLDKDLNEAREKYRDYDGQLKSRKKTLEDYRKDLTYKSHDEAQNAILDLKKNLEGKRKIKADLEKREEELKDKLKEIGAGIKTLEGSLVKKDKIDQDKAVKKLATYEAERDILKGLEDQLKIRLNSNKDKLNKYKKTYKDYQISRDKYTDINEIYKTLSGQIAGQDKLQFEVFVQMTYFDEIIKRANKRFYDMTFGQYQLRRKKGSTNRMSQSGLEIEILDKYSAKARHINTLSGGESFKAALALALGLSDTVQMYSGGIELDSMFIDEGFGSLDKESLSQVMASLVKLSGNNKQIGIISHVESLKESIDKKILVRKSQEGDSYVEVIG